MIRFGIQTFLLFIINDTLIYLVCKMTVDKKMMMESMEYLLVSRKYCLNELTSNTPVFGVQNELYNLQLSYLLLVNDQYIESPFSVSLYVCDKLNQCLHQNPLIEILTRMNDWLYHCRCFHEPLAALVSHLEGQLQ
jgi:hypothetical protein